MTTSSDQARIAELVERLDAAETALAKALLASAESAEKPLTQSHLVTEAQLALLHSEARETQAATALLDAILKAVPDIMIHVRVDGTIRWINRTLPWVTREETLGRDWLTFSSPDRALALKRLFEAVVATGQSMSHDGPGLAMDGGVAWYSTRLGPVYLDGEVAGVVVIVQDRTESKRAEAQLMVSDRMASVGMLAAGAAHELNNPLAAVLANLDVAAQDLKKLSEQVAVPRDLIDEIEESRTAAERVRLIVRDLKIFSRNEDERREVVDVPRVMESTLRMAWNEIRHRAQLIKAFDEVPPVFASESRLGQLFLNLVINAAHAIPEGNAARNKVRISISRAAQNILIEVSDTGTGIPKEHHNQLFTPFFTTKPIGVGAGLGLSMCHRIAASLGGSISFESEVGKGTHFRVLLPVANFEEQPLRAESEQPAHSVKRGRVLVVDDEALVAPVMKRILGRDHDLLVLDAAAKALDIVREGARFDVILCDLMMPEMTGMDLHAEIVLLDPDQASKMVFATGGAFTPRAAAFLDSVHNQRVEKPFDVQGLRALVNGLIR